MLLTLLVSDDDALDIENPEEINGNNPLITVSSSYLIFLLLDVSEGFVEQQVAQNLDSP